MTEKWRRQEFSSYLNDKRRTEFTNQIKTLLLQQQYTIISVFAVTRIGIC